MLTLSLFAACDKVLLDPIADQLSLVGIALRVTAQGEVEHPEGSSEDILQSKFVLPQLSLAAFWLATEDEIGRNYEQRVDIVAEADGKSTEVCPPFMFSITRDYVRTVQPVVIACRNAGIFRLEIYLKQEGGEQWGEARGTFYFKALEPASSRVRVTFSDESSKITSTS